MRGGNAQMRRARRVSSFSFLRRNALYVTAGPPASDAAGAADEKRRAGARASRSARREAIVTRVLWFCGPWEVCVLAWFEGGWGQKLESVRVRVRGCSTRLSLGQFLGFRGTEVVLRNLGDRRITSKRESSGGLAPAYYQAFAGPIRYECRAETPLRSSGYVF